MAEQTFINTETQEWQEIKQLPGTQFIGQAEF